MARSRGHSADATVSDPMIKSLWPPIYLLKLAMAMSTPRAMAGKNSGVAQLLSMIVTAPCARAAAVIAGTSCTSNVRLPGLSSSTARVAGVNNPAISPPMPGG